MYTQPLKIAFAPLLGLAFCFSLCACSTTSETFDCPAGKSVGCKSIAEVNQMVNRGAIPDASVGGGAEEGTQSILLPSSAPVISDSSSVENSGNKSGDKAFSQQADVPFSDGFFVQRIQEEHLRVWIAPFQDAQGNLHEGSIVHTVLKPGSWQIRVADPRVSDSRIADTRVADPRVVDPGASDANIDDPEVTDSQSSDPVEYP